MDIVYLGEFQMDVAHLQPENPEYVRLKTQLIEMSDDGERYSEVSSESGLQMLRIIDPRFVLDPRFVYRVTSESAGTYRVEYDLSRLDEVLRLPNGFLERMRSYQQIRRSATVIAEGYTLREMIQYNLPPSSSVLRTMFRYWGYGFGKWRTDPSKFNFALYEMLYGPSARAPMTVKPNAELTFS